MMSAEMDSGCVDGAMSMSPTGYGNTVISSQNSSPLFKQGPVFNLASKGEI
jgi:hypothetical protein